MDTYLIYVVEGYETFDKKTNTYTDVKRIEVIATSEKEAYEKARKLLKAKNYKVWGAYEKVMPGDFTKVEKEYIMFSYQEMGRYYKTQNAIQEAVFADRMAAKKPSNTNSGLKNEKSKGM